MESSSPILIGLALVFLAGIADAQGFVSVASIWEAGHIRASSLAWTIVWFAAGVALYVLATRFLQESGSTSAEVQATIWFAVTVVGIAVASGQFMHWALLDQFIAVGVLGGVGVLMLRTGA